MAEADLAARLAEMERLLMEEVVEVPLPSASTPVSAQCEAVEKATGLYPCPGESGKLHLVRRGAEGPHVGQASATFVHGECVQTLSGHSDCVNALCVSADGTRLFVTA